MSMRQAMKYKTASLRQTKKLAAFLAKETLKEKKSGMKNALVFALAGDLGSGKTAFVQGFLRAAGVKKRITSPTFVMVKNYKLKTKNYKIAYHVDCYRVQKPNELSALGLKEIFKNPENIVLVEWAERIKKILPKNAIWLKFKHGGKEDARLIEVVANA